MVETAWWHRVPGAESLGRDGLCRRRAPTPRPGRASVLWPHRSDPGGYSPGQQRGRMQEQRLANAAVTAPPDDPTDAQPEAPLLELPPVSLWPQEQEASVPSLGPAIAHVR